MFIFAIILSLPLFCFVGCASQFSFFGNFSQESVTLKVGESFEPEKFFESEKFVYFESENDSIISKTESNTFVANKSGETVIKALNNGLLIDVLKVYVKERFNTPTNLHISNDGLITWDDCSIILNGQTYKPEYTVKIKNQDGEVLYKVKSNSFQLVDSGQYEISIRAEGNDTVEGSDYSKTETFKFSMVDQAVDFVFNSEKIFGSQNGNFTWKGSSYGEIIIDGISKDVWGNIGSINFESYPELSQIDVDIILRNSTLGESKTVSTIIKKLYTPNLLIHDNLISWDTAEGMESLMIHYDSLKSASVSGEITVNSNSTILNGLAEGVYTLSYQAMGKSNFANGNKKTTSNLVGKISNVNTQCEIVGNELVVKFSTTSEYNKKFIVYHNSNKYQFEFASEKEGEEYVLTQSFELEEGENLFSVQALPTLVDGVFNYDGIVTSNVLMSDEKLFISVYNLDQVKNLIHSLDENGSSILQFDEVQFADKYNILVNDIIVENAEFVKENNVVKANIGTINKEKYGDVDIFEIKIIATKEEIPDQAVIDSETIKSLYMLSSPTLNSLNGGQSVGNLYIWQAVENAEYECKLYITDSSFDIQSVEASVISVSEPYLQFNDANYYVLEVRSYPIDENNYLPSDEYSYDYFFIAKNLNSPQLRLDFDEDVSQNLNFSGYVLKIKTVENGYKYDVYLNDQLQGSVFNENFDKDILSFNFDKQIIFSDVGQQYDIKVIVSAKDTESQLIHLNATANLEVNRLAPPSNCSVDDETKSIATFINGIDESVLVVYKDGTELDRSKQPGANVSVSISNFGGDFVLKAQLLGFDEFNNYSSDGVTYLSSEYYTFNFHRSTTPYDLNYSNEVISFVHNDRVENYVVKITVTSANGNITREIYTDKKSFNLENELAQLRETDEIFDSYFTQKTEVIIQVYADINQLEENIYYLPSKNATLKYDTTSTDLVIKKLDEVVLDFDEESQKIVWQKVEGDNVRYEVYYNGLLQTTINNPSLSSYEYDVSSYDFAMPGDYDFYIIAKSDNSLPSDKSKNITFYKLSNVGSLNVFEVNGVYKASFVLSNDELDYISEIIVNDESIGSVPEFTLDDEVISVYVKGKNYIENGNKVFFISSDKSNFNIIKLVANEDYLANVEITGHKLSWADYATLYVNNWILSGTSQNLKYKINIYDQENQFIQSISNISSTQISLTNEIFQNLSDGVYNLSLLAYISEYTILDSGKGYYGEILLEKDISLKKLNQVTNLKASIDNSKVSIDEEMSKYVNLSWEFNDVATSDVNFEIYLNDSLIATTKNNNTFIVQSMFDKNENIVSVRAISSTDVYSDFVTTTVFKFNTPKISISDEAVLSISVQDTYSVSEGFVIELEIENEVQTIHTLAQQIDLNEFINAMSGTYVVRVIQKATSQITLPNQRIASINGIVLRKPEVVQDETGLTFSTSDFGVKYYLRSEDLGVDDCLLEGNRFDFPDTWLSGQYDMLVYAVKAGCINSWTGAEAQFTINIQRITNVPYITSTRNEDYTDFNLSWDSIDNAVAYRIEIYQENKNIGSLDIKSGNNILLSNLKKLVETITHGEYLFVFRTLTDYNSTGLTNSLPYSFNVSILENTVENLTTNDVGILKFDAQNNGPGFFAMAENASTNEKITAILNATQKSWLIENISGKLEITVVQLAGNEAVQVSNDGLSFDAEPQKIVLYKLKDILSIENQAESGKLFITVENESEGLFRTFYVKTVINGETYVASLPYNKISDTNYEVLAIEIAKLFPISQEGIFNFSIYSVAPGTLRSEEFDYSFEFKFSNDSVQSKKSNEFLDYIVLSTDQASNVSKIHLLILEPYINKYLDVSGFIEKGWWTKHTYYENGQLKTEEFFSDTDMTTVEPEGEYISEECYAINMTQLFLEEFAGFSGNISLQIGYITSPFIVNYFSEVFNYTKLSSVSNLKIDLGNLKWDNSNTSNTGFILYFENEEGIDTQIITSADITYLLGEKVNKFGTFKIAIQAISNKLQVIPSDKDYMLEEVTKLKTIDNAMAMENGVITLNFDDERAPEDRNLDSVEDMLENKTDGSLWSSLSNFASILLSKQLNQPFSYVLEDISDLKFNLKFVRKDSQNEGSTYLTTVNAVDILSRLDQQTINQLSELASGGQITDRTLINRISTVVDILQDENLFNGVASSYLLFDEIGQNENGVYGKYSAEKIPAGVYDIYIQQQGASETKTLSSDYSLKLENKVVVDSPMTRTEAKLNSDGMTQTYFVKFRPVYDNDGDLFKKYTLVLRNKQSSEMYQIKINCDENNQWYRSSLMIDDANIPLAVDTNGYVLIALNDQNGLIYDEGAKEILYGNEFSADIYVNGDTNYINSKTENITIAFLDFDNESLSLKNGVFEWDNILINGKTYSTNVIYKKSDQATDKNIIISGSHASFTPNEAGEYDYIKFYTQGSASGFTVTVDSPVYSINNLQKLSAPLIKIVDGKIEVKDNNMAFTELNYREFILTNNAGGTVNLTTTQLVDGKYTLIRQTGTNKLTAQENESLYYYGLSERNATMHFASVAGDTVENNQFEFTESSMGNIDITIPSLIGEREKLILQSEKTSILAEKLDMSQANIFVNNDGNVEWTACDQSITGQNIPGGLSVVYEVEINYYYETSSGWQYSSQDSKIIYTTSNVLSAKQISDPVNDEKFKYVFFVRANLYSSVIEQGDIVTVEGDHFNKVENLQFSNSSYILDSELVYSNLEEKIDRSAKISDLKIINGQISWQYYRENQEDHILNFKVYAVSNGNDYLLEGEVSYIDGRYIFELNDQIQQLTPGLLYDFKVYAIEQGCIESYESVMFGSENVQILPIVEETDFETEQTVKNDGENSYVVHTLDFEKYFSKNSINQVYINIEVSYSKGQQEYNALLTSSQKTLKLQVGGTTTDQNTIVVDEGNITITLYPVPVNCENVLAAYKKTILNLEDVNWSEDDVYIFDEQSQTFAWSYGIQKNYRTNASSYIYMDEYGQAFGIEEDTVLQSYSNQSDGFAIDAPDYYPLRVDNTETIYYLYYQNAIIKYDNSLHKVRISTNLETNLYIREGNSYTISSMKISPDKNYELLLDSWTIKAKILDDVIMTNYYIPATSLEKLSSSQQFVAREDATIFTDADCKTLPKIASDVSIEAINFEKNKQYTEITYKNNTYWILTNIIDEYLTQDPSYDINNEIRFKVTIVTSYSYQENRSTFDVKSTRIYDNIPIGEISYNNLGDYVIGDQGIFVTTFQPNLIGQIVSFKVQVRKSQNNLLSKDLGYSETDNIRYSFDLFENGEGSQANPYEISTKEQFNNISYRAEKQFYHNEYKENLYIVETTSTGGTRIETKDLGTVTDDETVYSFKQITDFTGVDAFDLDGYAVDKEFVGNYDGNNQIIEINVRSFADLDSVIQTRVASGTSGQALSISKGAGLFKEIGNNGTIQNLQLILNVNFDNNLKNSLSNSSGLIGGLALINGGTVSQISVMRANIEFETSLSSGAILSIGGILGENKGIARELSSSATVDIENSNTQSGQTFYYAGLVGFNDTESARLILCENTGAISVNFLNNQNGVVSASGIAISSFGGTVEMAQNYANISAVCSKGSAYSGGILVHSYNGYIYSSVNTGNITAVRAGGIVYNVVNATIGSLVGLGKVNNAYNYLFMSTGNLASSSKCYTYGNYNPSFVTYEKITSSKNIDCRDTSYQIVIDYTSQEVYSVDIIKK